MAIVQLKDVLVTRVNKSGHGLQVTEESVSKGQTFKTRYTVWFKEASGLSEGSVVSLSGFLGARVDEWTDKEGAVRHTVELSVNSPRISGGTDTSPTPSQGDSWDGNTIGYDSDSPF